MRCINIDWLEVYALEPITKAYTADHFRELGFSVLERGYGTRIYEEMFTLVSADGFPFIEVRRKPKSETVLPINATHLRFTNRYCYYDNAGELMQQFLEKYGYTFVSLSRIDICLDFERFDRGDDPQKFVKRYIGHKYAKINQSQATAHFDDEWCRRDFNSLSWGSKNSDITTKMYNKTLELYDETVGAFKKPYILQAWFQSGLIDDPVRCLKKKQDGELYRPVIWRLEFSIKSNVKGWFKYRIDGDSKHIRSVRNTLETYKNRELLLPVFDLLQQHYFHFKKHQPDKVKYECKDKVLFEFGSDEVYYKVERPATPKKPDALVIRLMKYLKLYKESHGAPEIQTAAQTIIDKLEKEEGSRFTSEMFSSLEWEALRRTIALRLSGSDQDPTTMAADILHLLKSKEIY